jgi:hypothetical protein
MTIYSTSNLPKLLNRARDDGWRVLGAAADVPDGASAVRVGAVGGRGGADDDDDDDDDDEYDRIDDDDDDNGWDLGGFAGSIDDAGDARPEQPQRPGPRCFDLDEVETGSPTIIVLGSEGEGVRNGVARGSPRGGGTVAPVPRFSSIAPNQPRFPFRLSLRFSQVEACARSWPALAPDSSGYRAAGGWPAGVAPATTRARRRGREWTR